MFHIFPSLTRFRRKQAELLSNSELTCNSFVLADTKCHLGRVDPTWFLTLAIPEGEEGGGEQLEQSEMMNIYSDLSF